jgi:hypothetical protein
LTDRDVLQSLVTLSQTHGTAIIQQSVRITVLSELLMALFERVPADDRTSVAAIFRARIERLMELDDDRALPEIYHTTLLDEVNRFLRALE